MNKNPKCSGCYCYWIPDETDVKSSGEFFKLCKKCREYKKNKSKQNKCVCGKVIPLFGLPTDTKATCCASCKTHDMINIKNPKCVCGKAIPYFGLSTDTKAKYCNSCKTPDMINIVSPKCVCGKAIPYFGLPTDTKATCCASCKSPDMIDIKNPKCIQPFCDKYQQIDKYCVWCFYAINPNDNRCKRIKIKENEVKKFIQDNLRGLQFIYDEPLKGNGLCFNVRPDVMLHLNHHTLIVEVDENQHKFYETSCDEARTHKIQEALNRPIIIIRFNPDSYIDSDNKKIQSCFKIDKKLGLTTIIKTQEPLWNKRLDRVKTTILENITIEPDKPITIIKLFYDGF